MVSYRLTVQTNSHSAGATVSQSHVLIASGLPVLKVPPKRRKKRVLSGRVGGEWANPRLPQQVRLPLLLVQVLVLVLVLVLVFLLLLLSLQAAQPTTPSPQLAVL